MARYASLVLFVRCLQQAALCRAAVPPPLRPPAASRHARLPDVPPARPGPHQRQCLECIAADFRRLGHDPLDITAYRASTAAIMCRYLSCGTVAGKQLGNLRTSGPQCEGCWAPRRAKVLHTVSMGTSLSRHSGGLRLRPGRKRDRLAESPGYPRGNAGNERFRR